MKILYVLATSTLYGASKSLLVLLKSLNREKVSPYVVLNSYGPLVTEIKKIGIPIRIIPLKRWVIPKRYFIFILPRLFMQLYNIVRLLYFLKKERIDIVQSFSADAIEGAIAAKIVGIPHIWRLAAIWHIDPDLNPIVGKKLARKIIEALSDMVIPISWAVARYYPNYKDGVKFCIVHNAIDISEFEKYKNYMSFRKEQHIKENIPIVGSIGSICEHKGFGDFVKAASIVKRKYKTCKFVIVGSGGTYMKKLVKMVENDRLEKDFIFTGFRTDISRILSGFDIFVIPSWEEPHGRVQLEAMACRKPVIGTNSGGTPEIVIHNETGLLVPPKNLESLAQAIIYLLENPEKAKAMGSAGQKRVREFFSADRQAKLMEGIYKETLMV